MTVDDNLVPWAGDKMARKGVAKFLTRHLDAYPKIKVLNINSPWGSGKTFFLQNWVAELRETRACVYFNAWERDFTGDAFLSLVAAIKEQLSEQVSLEHKADNVIARFTQMASKTLVAATPALTKGVVKKLTGVDLGVFSDLVDGDAFSDAAEKAVESLIDKNKETLAVVDDFKKVFRQLVALAADNKSGGGESKPVYIFVDELDRCRPTFAIELLERVKHLFEIDDCKFIIATDTEQLSHSIKAVYGSGFGSERYLKRFFDSEFTLNNNSIDQWVASRVVGFEGGRFKGLGNKTVSKSPTRYETDIVEADMDTVVIRNTELTANQLLFLCLALTFGCKLRELEKIVAQIEAVESSFSDLAFDIFWGSYLVFLKDASPDLYAQAVHGDYVRAIQLIKEKFPPKKLYFGNVMLSIHEIFANYITRFRSGEQKAKETYRSYTRLGLDFYSDATDSFGLKFGEMASYPNFVDLAHSLE